MTKFMNIKNGKATISKYEVMKAFFLTEEEDDVDMANELNKMINIFYEQEQRTRRNVTELSFDIDSNQNVIDYIKKASIG